MENQQDFAEAQSAVERQTARTIAIKILNRFDRSDSYIDKLLENELSQNTLSPRDKALLTELVNGVIRWKGRIDWLLTGFYRGDYSKCISIVKNALRVALYQIMFLDKIPPYAAIDESVEIVKQIQGDKTAGLVNAVLRSILRSMTDIHYPVKENNEAYYFSVMYSYQKWMVARWIARFGIDETEKFLMASNRRPGVTLRVNTIKTSIDELKEYLVTEDIEFRQSKFHPASILILKPLREIRTWELFKDGKTTAQDVSASLATTLLAPQKNTLIFDLCSAPGGKAFYLAQMMENTGKIIAIEKYSAKQSFINQGAERLGITNIQVECVDAQEFESKNLADGIFLDAPCSGLGTIAKKPDIKWSRDFHDIGELVKTQKELLTKATTLLKVGGSLVYSVCTTEPEETVEIAEWFLKTFEDFELEPAEKYLPVEICKDGYMQTFPHLHNMDGAFAARFTRRK